VAIAELFLTATLFGAPAPPPCGPVHVETLARTRTSRVYERPRVGDRLPATYLCAAGRKPVRLDIPDDDIFRDEVVRRPLALNGRYAAYAVDGATDVGAGIFYSTDVQVTDVVRRRTHLWCGCRAFGSRPFSSEGRVQAIVLTDRGSIAWIGRGRLIAIDVRGPRKLDRRAVPGSLRLRGHRIFWRTKDGVYRTDTLRGSPHRGDTF
jgi:hypothetical protein